MSDNRVLLRRAAEALEEANRRLYPAAFSARCEVVAEECREALAAADRKEET